MGRFEAISQKIMTPDELVKTIHRWRLLNNQIVFTNGCFDILHKGHAEYLIKAAEYGNRLIIGLNSDASVKRLKGNDRPYNTFYDRAFLLASMHVCDAVVGFDENTPLVLIQMVNPDFLVKGGDYNAEEIVGYDHVIQAGGNVCVVPFSVGLSTTSLAEKIKGNQ